MIEMKDAGDFPFYIDDIINTIISISQYHRNPAHGRKFQMVFKRQQKDFEGTARKSERKSERILLMIMMI